MEIDELTLKKYDKDLQNKYHKYLKYKKINENAGLIIKNSCLQNDKPVNMAITQSIDLYHTQDSLFFMKQKTAKTNIKKNNNFKLPTCFQYSDKLMNLKTKFKEYKNITRQIKSFDCDKDLKESSSFKNTFTNTFNNTFTNNFTNTFYGGSQTQRSLENNIKNKAGMGFHNKDQAILNTNKTVSNFNIKFNGNGSTKGSLKGSLKLLNKYNCVDDKKESKTKTVRINCAGSNTSRNSFSSTKQFKMINTDSIKIDKLDTGVLNFTLEEKLKNEINKLVTRNNASKNFDDKNKDLKFDYITLTEYHKSEQDKRINNVLKKNYKKSKTNLTNFTNIPKQSNKNIKISTIPTSNSKDRQKGSSSIDETIRNRNKFEIKENKAKHRTSKNLIVFKDENKDSTHEDVKLITLPNNRPELDNLTNTIRTVHNVGPISIKDSIFTSDRYENYIKVCFKDRDLPRGYKKYLLNLKLSGELKEKKLIADMQDPNIKPGFMDIISDEIIKQKNPNKTSMIYKKLTKNENTLFGKCKLFICYFKCYFIC